MPRVTPISIEDRTQPYWKELNKVVDPELNLGVVDLGLIYKVQIDKKGHAIIMMSLTTPACPYGPMLIQQIEDRMRLYKGVKSVQTEIIWDPPWTQEMIDPELRDMMLGFY